MTTRRKKAQPTNGVRIVDAAEHAIAKLRIVQHIYAVDSLHIASPSEGDRMHAAKLAHDAAKLCEEISGA